MNITDKIKNLPILGWIKRYWVLLAALAILIVAYNTGVLALTLRGALLVPIFTLLSAATALLLRNVYNRKTTDKYVDTKDAVKNDWEKLSPKERILIMKVEFLVYFLGAILIGLGLL